MLRRCAPHRLAVVALLALLFAPLRAPGQARVPPARGYEAAVKELDAFIQREVELKGLPALSVALVDDQAIVWARGYGLADPKKKTPATAQTVYRVGSVSKLFTDIALMQLVERGALDLDAAVTKYLPDFKPANPFDRPITLRQLMSHRSGLVRESPVGSYFDPDGPSLARSVESLNRTSLVYEPGKKTKYSNAAVAVVGLVVEQQQKERFARYLHRNLLDAVGMKRSNFEPELDVVEHLAKATMWTYHGREFPAPTFELGTPPAGGLYSTVTDLGRFLSVLFAGGRTPDGGAILQKATLDKMMTVQFEKAGTKEGFGLGFYVREFEGRKRVGHGGAVYGFATDLSALPGDKLGVVVCTSRDVSNAVTGHIADEALRLMLAVKAKRPLPRLERTEALPPGLARKLAGKYEAKGKALDLVEQEGRLYLLPAKGGFRAEVRAAGKGLIVDDRLTYGQRLEVADGALVVGKEKYSRVARKKPAPPLAAWRGLVGEYGWDHNVLYVLEKDGKLHVLVEWVFLYPLERESDDVYRFPSFGLYHGEKVVFTRDASGKATQAEAAGVAFERRKLDGEDGSTFKITPLRPVAELRKLALAARPPVEKGKFRAPELVELVKLEPGIKLDIRYATANNFLSTPFYASAKAYMQRPAAEAVARAHKALAKEGYGLLVFDGYRPWAVTKMFWDATPADKKLFVANPADGSRHNRGCAVDLTLYDLKTGRPVEMVGGFDEMSDRSYPGYLGGTSLQRYHRELLRRAMEEQGFTVYEAEWWHFDYKDWRMYPILNLTFEELGRAKK